METIISQYLEHVSGVVGEYLTLDEMRNEGWKIPRRVLRERLPIEYPTVQAMYKSGFKITHSVLKRKIVIDPTTIERKEDVILTPDEIDSIAADILLYGVPDAYITDPNLYEGLPNWLQLVILDAVIDKMSTDMIGTFSYFRMAKSGQPSTLMGLNKDREDLMAEIARLMYKHKILGKHRELLGRLFDYATRAGMYLTIGGIMNAGYTPSFVGLRRLTKFPDLLDRVLKNDQSTPYINHFIAVMLDFMRQGIKNPQLVKLFASRKFEIVDYYDRHITLLADENVMTRRAISNIGAAAERLPTTSELYRIPDLEARILHNGKEVGRQRAELDRLTAYWR